MNDLEKQIDVGVAVQHIWYQLKHVGWNWMRGIVWYFKQWLMYTKQVDVSDTNTKQN